MQDLNSNRRFLVTGGAGFIGYRVVLNLLSGAPSTRVAVLDNLSVGRPMPAATDRIKTYEVDIRDSEHVAAAIQEFRPDTIVHLAAVHHIPTCERRRVYALDVNVLGTELLLELAETHGIKKFVLASSGAVYDWQDEPLVEDKGGLRPLDNYSMAKYVNERQVAFWQKRVGGIARIARIFNTIGHDDPNAHLIPDIVDQIPPQTQLVEIALGNLSPRRDYIHVDDTARAISTISLDTSAVDFDIFNVSTGVDISVAELVEMLGSIMGTRIVVREDPARMRPVDRPSQLGSTEKIRTRLGFVPQKSLRVALEDIVRNRADKGLVKI